MKEKIRAFAGKAIDTVLPPRCPVSGDVVDRQGMVAPRAWAGLDFIADPHCAVCGVPFGFEVDKNTACAGCLDDPPPFASARAAVTYNEASRSVILGFKHADKTYAVASFAPWLKKAGAEMLEGADCLAPVPLHRWRILALRYNQAAIIAAALAKETKLGQIPDLLIRTRATASQGRMNTQARFDNVKRAFALNPRHKDKIAGKTIVLIDDVYTTGATMRECAKVLSSAGAEKIHVLTVARVTREG